MKPKSSGGSEGGYANNGRRDFMKGAATAAGMLGAVGFASALAPPADASPQTPQTSQDRSQSQGVTDCRSPQAFQSSVPESLKLLSQYFQALSERNLDGMAELMHYPFLTHEGPEAQLVQSREQFISSPPLSMNVTGKGNSKIMPGAYDILDFVQMHIYSPVGAGLSMEYSRFDPRGTRIFSCHGLYGITNNDGKWGIEWVSTIFKPANQVGRDQLYNYPILDAALHENHRDHVMARMYDDLSELRESVFDPFPHGSVSLGPSIVRDASGRTRQEYRIEGVKTRLRYSKGDSREEMDKQSFGQTQFARTSGAGVGAWALSIEVPDTRMLYASAEKGHFYSGYYRYTEDGSIISEHRYLGALVNWNGHWYGNDISRIIGQVDYHDRSNDVHS
jgi:hypothetical protein